MFAQLGDIEFELITYFNGMDEAVSYNYAEHERIGNKQQSYHEHFAEPDDQTV